MKEELKNKIREIEWYRQAGDITGFYCNTPAIAVTRKFGPPAFFIYIKDRFEFFYPKNHLVKQSEEFLKKSKKDRTIVDDYFEVLDKIYVELKLIFNKLSKVNFNSIDKEETLNLLKEFDGSK